MAWDTGAEGDVDSANGGSRSSTVAYCHSSSQLHVLTSAVRSSIWNFMYGGSTCVLYIHTPRYFMALASSFFCVSDVIFGVARSSSWYDSKGRTLSLYISLSLSSTYGRVSPSSMDSLKVLEKSLEQSQLSRKGRLQPHHHPPLAGQ